MEIHEYQAKALFKQSNIKTLDSQVVDSAEQAFHAAKSIKAHSWVIKAQVHAGGRGLAGGIKKASTPEEVQKVTAQILGQKLITAQTGKEGKIIRQVLVEAACIIEKEFYLALLLDRSSQKVSLIASVEGGVSIEEVAEKTPEKILKITLDPLCGLLPFHVMAVLKNFKLPLSFFQKLNFFLSSLYQLLLEKESTLIEINPLAQTAQGELVALDAKMSIDDNALFRQEEMKSLMDLKELPVEEQKAQAYGLSFVKLSGHIGCLVNGAGLAMATMDIVKLKKGQPANFLDVGGGVDSKKIDVAFQILKEDPDVKGILVNIFGGIVKCDLIAEGLVKAIKLLHISIPVVVRLEGTHADQARQILNNSGLDLNFADNLEEAAEKVVSLVYA
ncbi:MAG: ADP-forming succinate--CoA ligase subunit beta [Bdellovibrionales bacterium]|nr:ADP-forming succinate--CoA ligase subunit beta [Bdellovibrionales bacterium]